MHKRKGQLRGRSLSPPRLWQTRGKAPPFTGRSRPGGKQCPWLRVRWTALAPSCPALDGQGGAPDVLPKGAFFPRILREHPSENTTRSSGPQSRPCWLQARSQAPTVPTAAHRHARYSLSRLMFSVNLGERGRDMSTGSSAPRPTPTAGLRWHQGHGRATKHVATAP